MIRFHASQTSVFIYVLRDVVYLSAKMFAYIKVRRRVSHIAEDPVMWVRIDAQTLPTHHSADLECVFMVNRALGRNVKFSWDEYQSSPAHHRWVSPLRLLRVARTALLRCVNVRKCSLDPNKSPSEAVVADCLRIIIDWPEGAQAVVRGSLASLRRARFWHSG